jgi:hypothetical protein
MLLGAFNSQVSVIAILARFASVFDFTNGFLYY